MPSAARLRGQARRTRMQLTGDVDRLAALTRRHKQLCAVCKRAGVIVYERCDEGWELIKAETRARNKLRYYDDDHSDKQEGLF